MTTLLNAVNKFKIKPQTKASWQGQRQQGVKASLIINSVLQIIHNFRFYWFWRVVTSPPARFCSSRKWILYISVLVFVLDTASAHDLLIPVGNGGCLIYWRRWFSCASTCCYLCMNLPSQSNFLHVDSTCQRFLQGQDGHVSVCGLVLLHVLPLDHLSVDVKLNKTF